MSKIESTTEAQALAFLGPHVWVQCIVLFFLCYRVLYIVEIFVTSPGQWNVNDEESTEGKLFHTGSQTSTEVWFGGKVFKIHMYMKSNFLTVEWKYYYII